MPQGGVWLAVLLGLTGGFVLLAAGPAIAAPEPRIVGGSATTISEWPWQAALVYDHGLGGNDFDRQFCGGSVIAPTIVLTAAHCVTDPALDPTQLEVVVGRTTLSSSQGQRVDVDRIVVDPSYDETTIQNDAAVLRLATPTSQPTISLAGPGEGSLWAPGADGWVTGWGSTNPDGSNPQDTLRQALVPIISDASCGNASVYGSDFFPAVMVCAGYLAGGVDSCFGDSGGPLMVAAGGGAWRQVGIVSWGFDCAQSNAPGVYSRVGADPLRSFIQGTVASLAPVTVPAETPAHKSAPCSRKAGVKRSRCLCKRKADKGKRRQCLKKAEKQPPRKPPSIDL